MQNYHDEEILGKAYDSRLMKRLLQYAKPYWKVLTVTILMLLLVTVTDLARPYIVKIAIDQYINPTPMVAFQPGSEPKEGVSFGGQVFLYEREVRTAPAAERYQLATHQGVPYLVPTVLTGQDFQVEEVAGQVYYVTDAGRFLATPIPDIVYREFRTRDIAALTRLALIFLAVIALGFVMNFVQIWLLHRTGQQIIFNLRQQIFTHLQSLSLRFFDTNPVGRLVTRVTNDTETLNEMFTGVLVNLFKDVFMLVGIVLVMFRLNFHLALISLAVMPLAVVATIIFRLKARDAYREVRTRLARINATLSENISGMRVIQIFHREKAKMAEFDDINDAYYKASYRELMVFAVFRPFLDVLYYLALAALIWYGGGSVLQGALGFGVLFAFVSYIQMFFQPINDLAEKYNILQASMASSERIFQLLDHQPDITSPQEPKKVAVKGTIEFKNVWFAYNPGDWVLRDVSFTIEKGQTVAFVGATGAGKSSIISLISRLYDIQQGQILLDGVDIREIDLAELRRNVAVVLQDVFMFSGTIAENIRLNNEEIDDERIRDIARAVDAHRFIEALPKAYESEVTERGSTMSAGQRQLLAFARALAFDPRILILDEATANIDTETEQIIQRAMRTVSQGRTTIVVAHRLSTIQNADQIVVMHKGKVREIGSHQQLLAKGGLYYHLYQLQFEDQELKSTAKQG
jgi:ATP-binding cassette subfamily B protein/subfamily B ATP-binding cassette protein MsbA